MLWQRGRSYAQDLRERVFAAFDSGLPVGQIAAMLLVSISYVSKALSRRRNTGETTARPQRCHVPRKLAGLFAEIRDYVAARPDATIAEIQSWLLDTHKVSVSKTVVWEALAHLNLTRKKRPCTPPSRTVRTSQRPVLNGARLSPA